MVISALISQAIQAVRAATQNRNPVPHTQRGARPESLPGTLLNAVFLSLPSEDQNERLAAWNLLCAICKAYHIDLTKHLYPAPGAPFFQFYADIIGLYVPPHNLNLLVGLSRQISAKAPHLSLDVIGAFLEQFQSYTPQQREYSLLYLQPWIAQMETQLRHNAPGFSETAKEVKSVLRALIRFTYEKPQVFRLDVSVNCIVGLVYTCLASGG